MVGRSGFWTYVLDFLAVCGMICVSFRDRFDILLEKKDQSSATLIDKGENVIKKVCIVILLVALVATRLMADGVADESLKYWPQWRGPTWNGVASEADPPVTWSETENLRWKTAIAGSGHGTPIIWGDRVFLQRAIALDKKMPIPDVIPADTPNIELSRTESVASWKAQRFGIVCIKRSHTRGIMSRAGLPRNRL